MVKFTVISFLVFFQSAETLNLSVALSNFTQLAESISVVIDSFLTKGATTANFVTVESSKDFVLNDLKEDLLRINSFKIPFRQEIDEKITTIPHRKKTYTIFLIKDINEFRLIYKQITSKFFKASGFYVFAVASRSFSNVEEISECSGKNKFIMSSFYVKITQEKFRSKHFSLSTNETAMMWSLVW